MSKNLYIVPYDFSPVSEKALHYALNIAKHVHTEIQILHLAETKGKAMAMINKLEEVKAKQIVPEGSEITVKVRAGSIFTDIGKIAKQEHAQLIIMGTHGSRGMQWLFGSHAMKVVTSADCPFLIVQKDTEIKDISSVVVPIDLTKESLQIVSLAGDMSKLFNADLHVIAEKQTDQLLNSRLKNRIGLVQKEYEERGIDAKIDFVKKGGKYGKKVMGYVKEKNIGMIAIAYHSESLFPQFDTFAQKLITNRLNLPVMVINSKLASALYF